jgi:hypothetical protein
LRLSGYYKDVSNQSRLVSYIGFNNVPNYSVTTNTSYEDIRGFEATLTKTRGDWIQGFLNYTYMVRTTGGFGWGTYYQDQIQQSQYEVTNPIITKPVPQPYARANIDLFSPIEYGPEMGGLYPLADWRVSLLGSWAAGSYFTWVGGGSFPGVANNAQWTDSYNFDMRISKGFKLGALNLQLFMDINNVFNIRHMENEGFITGTDYNNYMKSLHLPGDFDKFGYGNIDGSDRPGDYRPDGVDYQPMIYTEQLSSVASPNARPFYYEHSTNKYYQWVNSAWQPADLNQVNKALDNKAYICNPPESWAAFLNPRNLFFGLRMSFDIF